MAALLLFVFVFAGQLIAGFNTQLPPPPNGDSITILSIDGGGIRGIVPAVVLHYLEMALKAKDENASLAKYFDVIAGTSTGGLMTAMLTTPNPNDPTTPLFTPGEIVDFYKDYDELLKDTRLNQTLTNVVIPTFDLKKLHPVIFSNFKLKTVPSLNAKLSDICIGTSAAPTYLPPYYFENDGIQFNLVDGGVAATNPAMAAVSEVIQQEEKEYSKIMLLSIGCGSSNTTGYDAEIAVNFTAAFWMASGLAVGAYDTAATDMTHNYLATDLHSSDTYLRIQEYNLDPSMASLDNVTEVNLENLVKVGQNLLEQPVFSINVTTFVPEQETIYATNAEALERFADMLYEEKQLRLRKKSMEKRGRPFIETVTMPFSRTPTT
ncbi:Patatin-like phospholipase domain [Sesbania bispinosa]|nr:Patatin-like phospholipase domain [Sesbania bispinosa]